MCVSLTSWKLLSTEFIIISYKEERLGMVPPVVSEPTLSIRMFPQR